MKKVYYYLLWLGCLTISSHACMLPLLFKEQEVASIDDGNLANRIAWLRETLDQRRMTNDRIAVAESLPAMVSNKLSKKIIQQATPNLIFLLKKEKHNEMLPYLILTATNLGIQEAVNKIIAIFYSPTTNRLVRTSIIWGMEKMKAPEAASLVLYAAQHCHASIAKETCELPFHLDCEQQVLEQLMTALGSCYGAMSNSHIHKFINAIYIIKNHKFEDNDHKKILFNKKTLDALGDVFKHAKNEFILKKLVQLLSSEYSENIYKILTQDILNRQLDNILIRKFIILWLGSIPVAENTKQLLLKEINHANPTIRLAAIVSLKGYLTPDVVTILLKKLEKDMNSNMEKMTRTEIWEVIKILNYSFLLENQPYTLFYDDNPLVEKNQQLRGKIITTFQDTFNKVTNDPRLRNNPEYVTVVSQTLIRYLVYLKDETIKERLWDMLQSEKFKNFYSAKDIKNLYLRLHKIAPGFLLASEPQKKLVQLYIDAGSRKFYHQPFPKELIIMIFKYSFIAENKLHYESLPLIYTGKNDTLRRQYPVAKHLKIFE